MSRKRWFLLILAPLTVVLLVLVLTVVPFPQVLHEHNFWFGPEADCFGAVDTTPGTPITFDWQAESNTTFYAWHCVVGHSGDATATNWTPVYAANGTSGSVRISSQGGWYAFGTSCGVGPRKCVAANATVSFFGPVVDLCTPSA